MKDENDTTDRVLKRDPLQEADAILTANFYGRPARGLEPHAEPERRKRKRTSKPKPTHYKVICISMYTKDLENLEATVAELKRRGHTKANKSQLIRYALSQLDIDKMPPPQP